VIYNAGRLRSATYTRGFTMKWSLPLIPLAILVSLTASLPAHAQRFRANRAPTGGEAGAPPIGYGAGTTGGDSAPITYFSDLASLTACLGQVAPANCVASPTAIFKVYPGTSPIVIASNKNAKRHGHAIFEL
jgi:hypothetical protein